MQSFPGECWHNAALREFAASTSTMQNGPSEQKKVEVGAHLATDLDAMPPNLIGKAREDSPTAHHAIRGQRCTEQASTSLKYRSAKGRCARQGSPRRRYAAVGQKTPCPRSAGANRAHSKNVRGATVPTSSVWAPHDPRRVLRARRPAGTAPASAAGIPGARPAGR